MSAPELTPVDLAMHDILRRAITQAVLNEAPKNHYFAKLSEGEKVEVRMRLVTLSNLHTAVRDGDEHPHELIELSRLRGWFPEYIGQISAPTRSLPSCSLLLCQVTSHAVRTAYTCGHRESGGLVCEASGDPAWHDHKISEHTKLHDQMGNGYSCTQIDAQLIKRRNQQNEGAK